MKDFDRVFKNMDNVFKEMDTIFKEMEKHVEKVSVAAGNVARKIELGPWKPWFAWRPVTVNGKRVWMKKIYRRSINTYVDHDDWTRYEYGTIFDVIKEAE